MQIEPWQIPVLAMALLALPPSVHGLVQWVRKKTAIRPPDPSTEASPEQKTRGERLRTAILALVTVVLLGVFVVALGAEVASVLTSVATAVSALVSAVMTVQSFLTLQDIRRKTTQGEPPHPTKSDHARHAAH